MLAKAGSHTGRTAPDAFDAAGRAGSGIIDTTRLGDSLKLRIAREQPGIGGHRLVKRLVRAPGDSV